MTSAGLALSDAYSQLVVLLDEPAADQTMGVRLAGGLTAAEPRFREALSAIDQALAIRRDVDTSHLNGPLAPARSALETFDRRAGPAHADLAVLADLPAAARSVLGMDGPRTYVVLGQNSAELRPTGGFIGSLGLVRVEHGAIVDEEYRGSYTFDWPERGFQRIPVPMGLYLGGTDWAVQDANWSPDFPTTARTVELMLAHHQDVKVDGVIGFTTFAVGVLLEALGPLQVEGFPEPVTADTWYELAEKQICFPTGDPLYRWSESNKGEVLEPMLRAVMNRIQHADAVQLPLLLHALRKMIAERELQVSFNDPAPEELTHRYGADGRFAPPPRGDVLGVVDANLSYSKVGPYVRERVVHDVWLNETGVARQSTVTVSYVNEVTTAMAVEPTRRIGGIEMDRERGALVANPGVYEAYVRVYIPRKSRLLAVGADDRWSFMGQGLGFTTLERYQSVPAASERSVSYTYQIPTDLNPPGEYRLRVIKQAGTEGHKLEVQLHLPPELAAAANLQLARDGDTLVYKALLMQTLDLHVRLGANAR